MRISWFIALRYLFSKKTHHVINIISGVSIVGISLGTMALIIVLSVFNGFESLVLSLFNAYNPELIVAPAKGKTIDLRTFPLQKIYQLSSVDFVSKTAQENVLFRYKDNQVVATLKGVDAEYLAMNRMDTMIIDGAFILNDDKQNYAVFGAGVAYRLGVNLNDFFQPVSLYYPDRFKKNLAASPASFNTDNVMPSGVFSIQQEFDEEIVFVNLQLAQTLLGYDSVISAIELGLKKGATVKKTKQELELLLGDDFSVKDRFEQQELLYKVLKSEKLVVFLILAFIVFIAVFNVVGSLTMLILDKKSDIEILQSMGADLPVVRKIFLYQGLIITTAGAFTGLILGLAFCLLQMHFGFIKMPGSTTMIMDYYPVVLNYWDFIIVFSTIFGIGLLATLVPVMRIGKSK